MQNSEDLKILVENSSLLKDRLSRHVANGAFKEDKVEQQLLLVWFFWMLTVLDLFFFPQIVPVARFPGLAVIF